MSVIKVKLQENFVVLSIHPLEDETLSFKAKGLWAYCMSRPKDWQFHVSHLAKVSKDGIDGVYSALKELINAGYCRRTQKNENGKFGKYDYEISFQAEFKKSLPQRDLPHAEVPDPVNPVLPSIDCLPRMEKRPPPTPKAKNSLGMYDRSAWRGLFSDWSQEEFDFVWSEFIGSPPGNVKSQESWMRKVRERFISQKRLLNERNALITKRYEHCLKFDNAGEKWRGDKVTALKDRVEFTDGAYYKAVPYDVSEEEWKRLTGWDD